MRTQRVEPTASLLIESMRDVGYSLDTALADILDNSITAGARNIRIFADTSGKDPYLAIVDDGTGMSEKELLQAMRLGSRSPLEKRSSDDLGRFGLGMKTASFSQCRRLTVVTRKGGPASCARWNLDQVAKSNDWLVEIPSDTDSVPCIQELGSRGTLIVWQNLDRLVDGTEEGRRQMVARLDEAMDHLSLVFHRFLAGEKGLKRIKLSLNGRDLEPFDPFHSNHPATDAGAPETLRLGGHKVTIQPFTLPHHQKVSTAEWEKYGGPAGYVKNQGFYVYRGKRLIIHGTWFGLARQMELTKLARVRIDMPNGLDIDWKIDVKKASANPPRQVRDRLRSLIYSIGAASARVYTSRGKRLVSDSKLPVWQRLQQQNEISYRLNPDHPLFVSLKDRLAEDTRDDFSKIIEMVGATLPIDALFADVSGHPGSVTGAAMSPEAMEHAVIATFKQLLLVEDLSRKHILEMLRAAEPFRSHWELTQRVIRQIEEDGIQDV